MEKTKKKKLFSMNEFQTAISTNSPSKTLMGFLKLLQDKDADQDYVLEYLQNGGKCREILAILKNDSTISPILIFDIINEILLKIIAKYRQYIKRADNTAQDLLNNSIGTINKMLGKDSNPTQRLSVLKLLTTIATISTFHVKEILQRVDFQREILDIITKSNPQNNQIRHAYIKLIMAIIVGGNYALVGITIQTKSLLLGIINGLKYDPFDIVELVLSVMKNYILYSRFKTLKLKMFDTRVIQQLIDLYNWKGPKTDHDKIDQTVKIQMNELVHDFLLILCTSHKYGVIFHDRTVGLNRKTMNQVMGTILQKIDKPWQHSYVNDLVVEICKNCPDLIQLEWTYLLAHLEPRLNQNWFDAMEFSRLLLKKITPDCIEFAKDDLKPEQLFQVIKLLILPLPVLNQLNQEFETPKIRLIVLKLLKTMLETTDIYLNCIEKKWLNPDSKIIYKKIANYIMGKFPSALTILTDWQNLKDDDKIDYLDTVFDIVDFYQLLAPKLLDCLNEFNIKGYLRDLLEIESKQGELSDLLLKSTKSLLNFNRDAFKLNSKIIGVILKKIARVYYKIRDIESFNCLYLLLDNLDLIESDEIQIWIDGILNLKQFKSEIVEILLELLKEKQNSQIQSPIFLLNQFLTDREIKPSLKNYLSFVVLNLCHLKPTYWEICSDFDFISAKMKNYFNSWQNGKTKILNITPHLFEFYQKFSTGFLGDNFVEFVGNFDFKIYPNFQLNLLEMVVFYLTNQIKFESIQPLLIDNATILIKTIFNGDELIKIDQYVSVIFNNSIILNSVNIYKPGNLISDFLIDTIKILNDSPYDFGDYLANFREILVETLSDFFKKPKKREINTEIFQISQLTPNQCVAILLRIPEDIQSIQCCDLLTYCLNQLLNSSVESLPDTIIEKLCECFVNFSNNCQVSELAKALLNCFQKFPNTTQLVRENLIETILLLSDYNQDNLALCRFLLEKNPQFFSVFQRKLQQICKKTGFILNLLDAVIQYRDDLLGEIYENLQPNLLKVLLKPHKANKNFHNFYRPVGVLIDRYFVVPQDFCNAVLRFDIVEVFHVYLLNKVFKKVDKNAKTSKHMLLTFINLEMNLFKQEADSKKIVEISEIFHEFLQTIDLNSIGLAELFNKHENFNTFIKYCLKYGISDHVVLLEILQIFIDHLDEFLETIFELMSSHSKFLDVLMNFDNDNQRLLILELWSSILKKFPKIMQKKHLPILLSAYNGTKSTVDRFILDLLKLYQKNQQIQFNDFKPFYWGIAAANHYSIHTDIDKALIVPKASDILNNLGQTLVLRTITNPYDSNSYDLEFFLPLFASILAPENLISIYQFPLTGALSLTIIGLANDDFQIRLAACHVLSRYYQHLEQKRKSRDRIIWVRFIESVCKGTAVLDDYKLNNFASVFLARTALILLQPLNPMYTPLVKYLLAKSILSFDNIPELYTFLHYNKNSRRFILEVIRDGCQTNNDLQIFIKSRAFKLVSELCSSSLCDRNTRRLIFNIYRNCCKLQEGRLLLNKKCSFSAQVYSLSHLVGDKFNSDNNDGDNDVSMEYV